MNEDAASIASFSTTSDVVTSVVSLQKVSSHSVSHSTVAESLRCDVILVRMRR